MSVFIRHGAENHAAAAPSATAAAVGVTSTAVTGAASATGGHGSGEEMMMMKPYFHFTQGDVFLFKSLVPTSAGAVFGATIIVFILAILSRGVTAFGRRVSHNASVQSKTLIQRHASQDSEAKSVTLPAPKFVLTVELSRAGMVGLDTFCHYLLMLIAMTFNAGYIIAILVGVMVGEGAFGRLYRF